MSDTSVPPNLTEKKTIPSISKLLATGFYSGYSPIAPGTAGSLVGLAIYLIPGFENTILFSVVIVLTFIIGVLTSKQMEQALGEDPPPVVIDEIVGMWISLLFLPKSFFLIVVAFFLFRIFDIIKPQPARFVEKFKSGWGIMLDDVVAGVYSNIVTQLIILVIQHTAEV
ncbi:MAG: phosphatidylglycerophosphatase A [Ignavibacteriales bacterium]|nr:phosphatidylglycerophosphatase A [Ignavibacteriales bacterium]